MGAGTEKSGGLEGMTARDKQMMGLDGTKPETAEGQPGAADAHADTPKGPAGEELTLAELDRKQFHEDTKRMFQEEREQGL